MTNTNITRGSSQLMALAILPWLILLLSVGCLFADPQNQSRFVNLSSIQPTILVEMRYFGHHNFIGKSVRGYEANKCLLLKDVAAALSKVQQKLLKQGKSLKLYDCYRPQQAVTAFVNWARDLSDTLMKTEFYPRENKKSLIKRGYIASRSGHSRGDTVDLTIVNLPAHNQPLFQIKEQVDCTTPVQTRYQDNSLDMGTGYDCFDPLSHTKHPKMGVAQLKNRLFLKKIMEQQGFRNYSKEWWHYTFRKPSGNKEFYNFVIK